jgi:hypothetical protein
MVAPRSGGLPGQYSPPFGLRSAFVLFLVCHQKRIQDVRIERWPEENSGCIPRQLGGRCRSPSKSSSPDPTGELPLPLPAKTRRSHKIGPRRAPPDRGSRNRDDVTVARMPCLDRILSTLSLQSEVVTAGLLPADASVSLYLPQFLTAGASDESGKPAGHIKPNSLVPFCVLNLIESRVKTPIRIW